MFDIVFMMREFSFSLKPGQETQYIYHIHPDFPEVVLDTIYDLSEIQQDYTDRDGGHEDHQHHQAMASEKMDILS